MSTVQPLDLIGREYRQQYDDLSCCSIHCLVCYISHVHPKTTVAYRLHVYSKLQKMAQAIYGELYIYQPVVVM